MVRSTGRLALSAVLAVVAYEAMVASALATPPPPNDAVENATLIASLPFADVLDTSGATLAPGEEAAARRVCGFLPTFTRSVWYRYTAPADQVVLVDARQSDYAVGVGIGRGYPTVNNCLATFRELGSFRTRAGQTYTLSVVRLGSAEPVLRLSVIEGADVRLHTQISRRRLHSGQTVTFRITVAVKGEASASQLSFCNRLPGIFVYKRLGGATLRDGQACWAIPRLDPGHVRHLRFAARAVAVARRTLRFDRERLSGSNILTQTVTPSLRVIPAPSRAGGVTG